MNNFEHFGIPAEKTISYTLELLTPYEKSLGTIPMVLNYNYKNKLIGLNEIDFDIPAYMIVEDKEKAHPFFHLIENGMIIQVTIVGQTEPKQYIVDTANKSTDKSSEALKHIHAFSKEYFLSRKKFLGMELAGRILYYTPDLPPEYATDGEGLARGVLNDIFTKYGIKVSHIDETLKKKAREVSIGSGNIYQLISHLEEVFGCIFKFNGNATEVAIYDSSTFGRKTNLTISERNIINSFSEDSRYEDMVTRMYVYGSDDVSIASVNPTGSPYIEDLTYFLKEQFLPEYLIDLYKEFIQLPKNTGLLQASIQERNALLEQIIEAEFYLEVVRDELRQATHWVEALQLREKNGSSTIGSDPQYSDETAWNSLKKSTDVLAFIDAVKKNTTTTDRVFTVNNISFVSLLELSRSANDELTELFKDNLETLQARGGEAGWLAEITRLKNALTTKENEIKNLQQNNDFDNYMRQKLTTEQLVESRRAIEAITIEGEYVNSDLDSSMLNELLAEGEKALAKACFPKIQFQVEALDFSQLLDTEDLWNYLTLGDTVFIKSDTGFNYPVYFIGIEHSPESASLSLQFSSAAAMTDSAIFLADLIASATRANGILALNKENWNEAAEGTTLIKAQLQQGLDLAKQQLDGASKQQPILDERGFWLYALDTNGNPKPEQIRAVNNVIALTEDGWETINVAITPQGINADTIVVGTLSADRVRLGRFESADRSTFWDLETNEIKIGDNFHFSPSTGLQINFEEEPKHKNLISTAEFFTEQSVLLPYGATHRFETNPSTGELSLVMPKQSGTYIFYIASDSATLTQDFTLLVDSLTTYGEATPTIKYALASTQFDVYSEEVAHIQTQKIYTLKPNGTTVINPLGFLQVSITKDITASETIVKILAESLALVKNNVANLTWGDTEISGVSSSMAITDSKIGEMVTKTTYNADTGEINKSILDLTKTSEGLTLNVKELAAGKRVNVDAKGVPMAPYQKGNVWYKDEYNFTQGYDILTSTDTISLGDLAFAGIWIAVTDNLSGAFSWKHFKRVSFDSSTQLSILDNEISMAVKEGDLISKINAKAGQVLITASEGNLKNVLNISPLSTYIQDATIKSAHIESLDAGKITVGTLDASKITVKNLSANSINAGTLRGTQYSLNLATGVTISGDTSKWHSKLSSGEFEFYNGNTRIMKFNPWGLEFSEKSGSIGKITGVDLSEYNLGGSLNITHGYDAVMNIEYQGSDGIAKPYIHFNKYLKDKRYSVGIRAIEIRESTSFTGGIYISNGSLEYGKIIVKANSDNYGLNGMFICSNDEKTGIFVDNLGIAFRGKVEFPAGLIVPSFKGSADHAVVGSGNYIEAVKSVWYELPAGISMVETRVATRGVAIVHKYADGINGSVLVFGYANNGIKKYNYANGTWTLHSTLT